MNSGTMLGLLLGLLLCTLGTIAYVSLGGPKLIGRGRGLPWCNHNFGLVEFMNPQAKDWTCPRCRVRYALDAGRWRAVR